MYKQINILLLLFSQILMAENTHELPAPKLEMIKDVREWVSTQTNQSEAKITVKALDRRLKVPECPSPFEVSFPYKTSQKTVLARCPDSNWFAYIGIDFRDASKALVFSRAFSAGEVVTEEGLETAEVSKPYKDLITSVGAINKMLLTKNVAEGDIARKQYFTQGVLVAELQTDILEGTTITVADVTYKTKSKKNVPKNTLFPRKLFDNATAARDLTAGSLLTRSDLNIRRNILTSQKIISRGESITGKNAKVTAFYGDTPEDALGSLDESYRMESLRTIRLGQPIRASDLKPMLMVKKGDAVVMDVGSGLLTIKSTMTALENGKLDQQINLLNLESNETVRAIITGPGRAKGI